MHYSLIMIIIFNVMYQTLARLLPGGVSPFYVQLFMYGFAFLLSLLSYFLTKNTVVNYNGNHLILIAMGLSIFMLELGYILANQNKVPAQNITLVTSILIVICLIIINNIFFKENLNTRVIIGLVFGFVSLYFLI